MQDSIQTQKRRRPHSPQFHRARPRRPRFTNKHRSRAPNLRTRLFGNSRWTRCRRLTSRRSPGSTHGRRHSIASAPPGLQQSSQARAPSYATTQQAPSAVISRRPAPRHRSATRAHLQPGMQNSAPANGGLFPGFRHRRRIQQRRDATATASDGIRKRQRRKS